METYNLTLCMVLLTTECGSVYFSMQKLYVNHSYGLTLYMYCIVHVIETTLTDSAKELYTMGKRVRTDLGEGDLPNG